MVARRTKVAVTGHGAAVTRLTSPATMNHGNLFDPVPTIDSAKIRLAVETTIVSSLVNLFGTIGHADRVEPKLLHGRHHLNHFRWLMHKVRSTLSLVVHKTTVLVLSEIVHEPIS